MEWTNTKKMRILVVKTDRIFWARDQWSFVTCVPTATRLSDMNFETLELFWIKIYEFFLLRGRRVQARRDISQTNTHFRL